MIGKQRRLHAFVVAAFAATVGAGASSVDAQTIEGVLMEVSSETPVSLGLIIMMTEQGDSVTSAVTDGQGRFQVQSDEAGSFYLIASAFGFKETTAGIFELGPGGSMTVEFRVGAEAMPIDGILVELQRPAIEHQLISNGFVRRLQRGRGRFITPYDIEQSTAMSVTDLFRGIPGVAVRTVGGGFFSFLGESVQFLSSDGYCNPTVYIDGVRLTMGTLADQPLESFLPYTELDAVEIYRRPSEVPVEYSMAAGTLQSCGVLVLWTKRR